MKKHIACIALFGLVTAGLVAVPTVSRADDATTSDKPAATAPTPKHKNITRKAYHGSVTAVDTAAMSLTVGTNTLYVTSETKITQAGKPATLSEITVGETAKGTYKVEDTGKLNANTINAGEKEPKKPRKKAKEAAPAVPAPAPETAAPAPAPAQ